MLRASAPLRNLVFTEQSPVLRQAATALNLKNNVWVEDWFVKGGNERNGRDLKATGNFSQATKVSCWKALEMYNTDQVLDKSTGAAVDAIAASQHTSLATRKPYGKGMSFEMENISAKRQFESKWWIPSSKLYGPKAEYTLRNPRDSANKFFITANMSVYPLEKLEGASADILLHTPISGATRRFYSDTHDRTAHLKGFAEEHNFGSYCFFTDKQLQLANLPVRQDQEPCAITSDSTNDQYVAYNIEQLKGANEILESIGRYGNPDTPVYLFSGSEVRAQAIVEAQKNFKQRYWVTRKDVMENQWAFNTENETAVSTSTIEFTNNFFNVMQLENPTQGFVLAGLLEMQRAQQEAS